MRRFPAPAPLLALAALVLLPGCDRGPTDPGGAGPEWDVAFLHVEGRRVAIEVATADGARRKVVHEDSVALLSLAWAPDGVRLAFVRRQEPSDAIHVLDTRSGAVQRFADERLRSIRSLQWLRGGEQVAFIGNAAEVWRVDADGTDPVRLLGVIEWWDGYTALSGLKLSPDGRRLAWTGTRVRTWHGPIHETDLYVANVDGTGLVNLSGEVPGWSGEPSWMPDSRTIVFRSDRDGSSDLFRTGVDGTGVTNLTRSPQHEDLPSASPDGRWIAFYASPGSETGLYLMDARGGGARRIATGRDSHPPQWAPNGRMVVWNQHTGTRWDVVAVDAGGGEPRVIAQDRWNPVWQVRR